MTVREQSLPGRVVVGANGAYWRDFGTHYSMCPVSEDNDPVEIAAIYVRDRSETTTVLPSDRWTRDGAMVYIDAEGDDARFVGDAVNEEDASHFVEWHNAVLDTAQPDLRRAPETEIDVERLTEAISVQEAGSTHPTPLLTAWSQSGEYWLSSREIAERIAAEYAKRAAR